MFDPREDAEAYIREKNINKLFQAGALERIRLSVVGNSRNDQIRLLYGVAKELGTRIMYHRPKDPNKFLLEVLGTFQAAKEGGTPTAFFTEQDIDAMFSLFDPTGRGHVSQEQYQRALETLGIDEPIVEPPATKRIGKEAFRSSMSQELAANFIIAASTKPP